MSLKTTGEVTVDATRPVAFAFVQDPQRLAACIPGCRDLREVGPGRFEARLTSRVAVTLLEFKVQIEVGRIDRPRSIDATIAGDAVGLSGRVSATAGLELTEEQSDRTRIRFVADVALTGKLGSLGQPVFRATSAQLGRQFGDNLKSAIEGLPKPAPPTVLQRLTLFLSALWQRARRFCPGGSQA